VLAALQRALPDVTEALGYSKERYVVVSGIGCSSRLPYYMNTYGFHSIHGRATAISTGIKVANPDLAVWQACGDGDALAIGGNHFIHAVRRNIDINVILFNNEIYGLTKGQYSPTSKLGKVTKTSPYGTIEHPFTPGELVLGARGTFFARSLDMEIELTKNCLVAAAKHDGTSVVEVMQNCVIWNDKTHAEFTDKEVREDRTIVLEHGKPMLFGKNKTKGLILSGLKLVVGEIGVGGVTMKDILVHDAHEPNPGIHMMLVNMKYPDYPVALGVIRDVEDHTYDDEVRDQVLSVQAKTNIRNMDDLLNSGDTWEIE
jgi:2-oxoglutarate ferredoxin oxidoreductase subunit beta